MLRYAFDMKKRNIPWPLVEQLLSERGKDRAWLKEQLEVENNVITNWKQRGVPRAYADGMAALFKTSTDYLLGVPGATKDNLLVLSQEDRALLGRSGMQENSADTVSIKQFTEIGGSMGGGVILRDQPGEIRALNVTPEWVNKNIKNHTGIQNLCIVTGFGNSMQPLFNPGDPLIVDTGIKSVDVDATYFFRVGEEGFIKILQRIPGEGIRVISKNRDYETWTIKPGMDFEVFGQVLKAWCGTDV